MEVGSDFFKTASNARAGTFGLGGAEKTGRFDRGWATENVLVPRSPANVIWEKILGQKGCRDDGFKKKEE